MQLLHLLLWTWTQQIVLRLSSGYFYEVCVLGPVFLISLDLVSSPKETDYGGHLHSLSQCSSPVVPSLESHVFVFCWTPSGIMYLYVLYLYTGKRNAYGHEANNRLFLPPLTEVIVRWAPLFSLGLLYEDLPFWSEAPRLWESVSFGVQAEADLSIGQKSRKLEGDLCGSLQARLPLPAKAEWKKMAECTPGSGAGGSRGVLWDKI